MRKFTKRRCVTYLARDGLAPKHEEDESAVRQMLKKFNEKYNANLTAKAQSSDVCFRCHKQGHWAIECPEGHEPEWLAKQNCYLSGKKGHLQVACPNKIKTDDQFKTRRGPSYWKFNSSLIEDENYVSAIEQKIPEWLEEFIDVTDKRVLWDLIKYRIRQFTMKYSKEISFKRKQELLQIEASIKQAEETLISDPSASNLEALEKLKNKYDSHFNYIAKGAIVRSRATWYEQGEKSNKYFLGLESNRGKKSCIRRMFTSKGSLISNQKNIMAEIENFYSDLYASNDEEEVADPTFFQAPGIPKLTLDMKGACEGKLRVKECFDCLQSFENCKSPGEDGLTAEFYKTFWNSVGHLLVDSLNYSYDHGELSNTQKQAIIKLIEKKGKDKRYIGNWRPISLINVDAKIGSKVIPEIM